MLVLETLFYKLWVMADETPDLNSASQFHSSVYFSGKRYSFY
jgi:hypothetical protein